MGAVIMTKVQNLDLSDIVNSDFSMEKISQALLKYVLNSEAKMRQYFDDQIDEVHDRISQVARKRRKRWQDSPVKGTPRASPIKGELDLKDAIMSQVRELNLSLDSERTAIDAKLQSHATV